MIAAAVRLPVHYERQETPVALRLLNAIPPPGATAVGISIPAHAAVYGLTPMLSLHVVALGGSATQVGLLFSVFALVAVVLRPTDPRPP